MMSIWTIIAFTSVIASLLAAVFIWSRINRYPQKMKVMNAVWILTALWGSWIAVWAYLRFGENKEHKKLKIQDGMDASPEMPMEGMNMERKSKKGMQKAGMSGDGMQMTGMNMSMSGSARPFWQTVTLSALHCGAGCTLADIIGESIGYLGFRELAGWSVYWQWTFDYLLALIIGVLFQYAAIHPMTQMPVGQTLWRAFKIDFFSLTSWQIGMYFWVYIIFFIFPAEIFTPNTMIFWFVMQIAMLVGFLFAYPINYILIKTGIKPGM